MQGNDEDDADNDQESSEEESEERRTRTWIRNVNEAPVVFPSETEYKAGFIWGEDVIFEANIENICIVKNVETNHRILSHSRVNEIYDRLRGSEVHAVSVVILRPTAYLRKMTNENGDVEVVEKDFSKEGAA